MIDKCDPEVATWSESGDNFVVKNVEKFASVRVFCYYGDEFDDITMHGLTSYCFNRFSFLKSVLPLYFKHSNFSSFARQLNFYGFRKLRTDPILTTEVDPCTACYVRFYHEKFQRDRPELLQDIKRATKSDQQSRDDIDVLKAEMNQLKEAFRATVVDYDRKLAELSYECNRRITSMNAEFDKLLALIEHALGTNVVANNATSTCMLNSLRSALNGSSQMGNSLAALNAIASATAPMSSSPPSNTDLLHSLSQAAVSLQNKNNPTSINNNSNNKRPAPDNAESHLHGTARLRQV